MDLIKQPEPADLNRARGMDAYRWNSFTPEKRVDADIAGYVKDVLALADLLAEAAGDDPAKIAEAVRQVEAYRLRYIEWEYILWAAKSRTASPMVTGPARFPVERNRKAMNAEMKKWDAYQAWATKAEAAALKAVRMVGYVPPPKAEGEPSGHAVTFEGQGIKVVENFDMDRLQIVFDGKPGEEERATLKGSGFKWAPSQMAWQRQLTNNARYAAQRIIKQFTQEVSP